MIIILLISSAVSFLVAIFNKNANYIDSIIILIIVVINSFIGIFQENKAEEAIDSLKKLSTSKTTVIRDSKLQKVPTEDIVPGDIILLKAGDIVCADARIIDSYNFYVEESSLTGESNFVEKDSNKILKRNIPIAEQKNMLFATSFVSLGHAKAVVIGTGMNTKVGKIAKLINNEKVSNTPLQKKLSDLSKILGIAVILISIVIFVLGIIQNIDFLEMFMLSISLSVAAIPEGLPAVVTVVLAIGVRKMAEKNAIIRKLTAVEALGSADIICSDKTGTLTQNKMTLVEIASISGIENSDSKQYDLILTLGVLCNNSHIKNKTAPLVDGEPTENAIILKAIQSEKNKNVLDKKYKRIKEISFDSKRKRMTTIHLLNNNNYRVITKGAPDVLLNFCNYYQLNDKTYPLKSDDLNKIRKIYLDMTSRGLRVLGVAYKDSDTIPNSNSTETDLIFCGIFGIKDQPRPEIKNAIKECQNAGIKPVMITGDHVLTAQSIAKEIGILKYDNEAITGNELDKMSKKNLVKNISKYTVFARVSPEHKAKIVKAFQETGSVVAMTGDGVNDAPALKVADIGCAMGISGKDVAKSASDLIMTDDNFSTIVEAVRQGRGIYNNIKKTIHFLLSTNIGEILTVLIGFILKLPSPLLPIHLLWINLVTDSFPALALGMEPIDEDVMKHNPQKYKKGLFSDGLGYSIILEGSLIGALGLLSFVIGNIFFDVGNQIIARTMAFSTLSISQLLHVFNVRNNKSIFNYKSFFSNPYLIYSFLLCLCLQILVVTMPFLNPIFKTCYMNSTQWFIVIVLSIIPLVVSELEKFFLK